MKYMSRATLAALSVCGTVRPNNAAARSTARADSYSQFVPGKTGMRK